MPKGIAALFYLLDAELLPKIENSLLYATLFCEMTTADTPLSCIVAKIEKLLLYATLFCEITTADTPLSCIVAKNRKTVAICNEFSQKINNRYA